MQTVLSSTAALLGSDELQYLNGEQSLLERVNKRKRFVLTATDEMFAGDAQVTREAYDTLLRAADAPRGRFRFLFRDLRYSPPMVQNALDFRTRRASARNMLVMGRLRGLRVALLLREGRLSPDDAAAQCEKKHGFDSVDAVM